MKLKSFFENYIKRDSIFKNKKVLQSDYIPKKIFYREEQIQQLANILAPILKLEKPSNIFIYGKTGSGKTLSILYILKELENVAIEKSLPIKTIYINCKLKRVADTEYRIIAYLCKELGKEVPFTGIPTQEVYDSFFKIIEKENKRVIIVLDEIDHLIKKKGENFLYTLIRMNSQLKDSFISLVGISNDLFFAENLDPRIKSSLNEEEIFFPAYNALQLKKILYERAKEAFKDGVVSEGVVEKCAAIAARQHGDARKALDLLRIAAEIAERKNKDKITIDDVDEAEEKIDNDRLIEIIKIQPKQYLTIIYSSLLLYEKSKVFYTGDLYSLYEKICKRIYLRPLTQRRVSDIISELDMFGILNVTTISKGRYGRTREITLAISEDHFNRIKSLVEKELNLK